jgi:glutamate synthase domain-containing protein 3
MTGGVLWLHGGADPDAVYGRLHPESVHAAPADAEGLGELRAIVEEHLARTGSPIAAGLLADWHAESARFVKVVPVEAAVESAPAATPVAAPSQSTRTA